MELSRQAAPDYDLAPWALLRGAPPFWEKR
jgi:hypothetical protein